MLAVVILVFSLRLPLDRMFFRYAEANRNHPCPHFRSAWHKLLPTPSNALVTSAAYLPERRHRSALEIGCASAGTSAALPVGRYLLVVLVFRMLVLWSFL